MTRLIRVSLLACALLALSGTGLAEAQTIVRYTRAKLYYFDKDGNPRGEVSTRELPVNVPAEGEGRGRTVGVRWKGQVIYLDPGSVVLDGASREPCVTGKAVAARAPTQGYAASSGKLALGSGGCGAPN